MSVLTKLFVVLLVVLALVETSALIVFVNKTENFAAQVKSAEDNLARAEAARILADQEAIAARGEANARVIEAVSRADSYRQLADAKTGEVTGMQAQLAAAQTAQTKAETDAQSARLAAEGAIKTVEAQQKVINDTAGKLTGVEKQYTESQTRLAQLVQELDGAKATIRRLREDNVALNERLDEVTSGNGGRALTASEQQTGAGAEALLNLRGVIKGRRNINGVEYATITLGSADNVTKGMKFKVIDQNNFLGYLTIDNVEPNEAVGHLEGPNIAQVRPGTEVRTQW